MNRRRCILSSCKDCSLQEVRCRAHCLCHRFLRQRCPIFTRSNFSCFSKFLSISLHNNTSVYKLVHDEQYLSKAVKQGCLLHIFSESNWNGIVKWVEDLHWYFKKRKKKKAIAIQKSQIKYIIQTTRVVETKYREQDQTSLNMLLVRFNQRQKLYIVVHNNIYNIIYVNIYTPEYYIYIYILYNLRLQEWVRFHSKSQTRKNRGPHCFYRRKLCLQTWLSQLYNKKKNGKENVEKKTKN